MRLVLLDRDNTIVMLPRGVRYLYGDAEIQLVAGAAAAIRWLNELGIRVVVATNQQGVSSSAYPAMTMDSVNRFHGRLNEALRLLGARLDGFYVCPHPVAAACDCRKPRPGLILRALRDFGVAPAEALMIGDLPTDLEAAGAAAVQGAMVCRTPARVAMAAREGWPHAPSIMAVVTSRLEIRAASDQTGTVAHNPPVDP